jgi:hypothetical protein
MLITDQLSITQPEALRRALSIDVQVRNYEGRVYHPKVFLFYGAERRPSAAVLGSANLSESGLTTAVEAGVVTTEPRLLSQLRQWFVQLFTDLEHTVAVDTVLLRKMQAAWQRAAATRARERVRQPRIVSRKRKGVTPEERDVLDDLFAGIQLPIGVLSFDHAGNNVRNLQRARDVLRRYPNVNGKERSELHLLGFVAEGNLTELGEEAVSAKGVAELARVWCGWIARTPASELARTNERLASFKRAATGFWRLRREVRDFFFGNLRAPKRRRVLQTIELLCNAGDVVRGFSLDDVRRLAPLVMNGGDFGDFVGKRVREYQLNKGARSWDTDDRRTVLLAWTRVAAGGWGRAPKGG